MYTRSYHTCERRRPGFTIVELLVVIAIIAILMGLLFTGLRAARGTAHETQQLSNIRQLFVAWSTYGTQSNDSCLPGFMTPEVQSEWKIRVRNEAGQQIDPLLAQTYVWRLSGYTNFNTEQTIGYLDELGSTFAETLAIQAQAPYQIPAAVMDAAVLPGSAAALQPAFGYNAFYLGGWWEMDGDNPRMRFTDAKHPTTDAPLLPVARSISNITRPELMTVFTGSIFAAPGHLNNVFEQIPGSAWVTPPFLAETAIWRLGPDGDSNSLTVLENEGVPLRRFNAVVYGTADGSQRKGSYRELYDMSLWTNRSDLTEVERLQPVHTEN